MAKHNLLISITFLALLSTFANTVLQSEANNTHSTFHIIPTTPTMANAQAPTRGHGRGRAFGRGGRGAPRGGRNAANPQEPTRDGGSPRTSHLSTLHDASSTTDDTIELFTQVKLTHQASHSITVSQKHVENVCEGLNSRTKTNETKKTTTAFTPDSLYNCKMTLHTTKKLNKHTKKQATTQ